MTDLPSLPPSGALRVLAVAGSIALLSFAVSLALSAAKRKRRDAAWAAATLTFAVSATALGRVGPGWLHGTAALLALGLGARDCVAFRGPARAAAIAGTVAWACALVAARLLFG